MFHDPTWIKGIGYKYFCCQNCCNEWCEGDGKEVIERARLQAIERDSVLDSEQSSALSANGIGKLLRISAAKAQPILVALIFTVSSLPIARQIISHWISAWNHGGNPTDWSVRLASAGSSAIGSTVAVWTGVALYAIGLICVLKATWGGIDESDDDNKSVHQLFAFVGSVILTVHFWGQVSDSRYHVAMVAACVILPFVPFIRMCVASLGVGIAAAYVLVVPAWILGWTAGSVSGWFSASHPVQSAPADPERKTALPQDSTTEIINRIKTGR